MALRIILDEGNTRKYELESGEIVQIEIDEDINEVTVTNFNSEEIGSVEFRYFVDEDIYKLSWMYLDKLDGRYLRQGIGRECVRFFKEFFGCIIIAEHHDGIKRDDGSHLTGDAPAFVEKLRIEKLIVG